MKLYRLLILIACMSLVFLLPAEVFAEDEPVEEGTLAVEVLESADSSPAEEANPGGLCRPAPPIDKATCVPPDGCGTFVCRVHSDCDELCCGPNFGRCVSACAPKPNAKGCICLA